MKLFGSILTILGLCVAMAACESNTKFKEDMLSSAGFKATAPKTPTQVAMLKNLLPHKLTKTTYKGKTVWLYSDPTICGCLYVGNQIAHDAYLRKQTQQAMLDMKNVPVPDEAGNWDFNSWPEAAVEL